MKITHSVACGDSLNCPMIDVDDYILILLS